MGSDNILRLLGIDICTACKAKMLSPIERAVIYAPAERRPELNCPGGTNGHPLSRGRGRCRRNPSKLDHQPVLSEICRHLYRKGARDLPEFLHGFTRLSENNIAASTCVAERLQETNLGMTDRPWRARGSPPKAQSLPHWSIASSVLYWLMTA